MVPLDHVYIYGKSSIQNNYKNEAQKANVWTFTRYNKYFNHSSDLNVTTISWTLCLVVQFPMRPYFSSSSFMFLWKILEILSIYHIGELAYECVCVNVWECAVHRSCVRRGKGRECGERTVLLLYTSMHTVPAVGCSNASLTIWIGGTKLQKCSSQMCTSKSWLQTKAIAWLIEEQETGK